MVILLLIILIFGVVAIIIWSKTKKLKLDAITLINGGVKCGKTTLAVHLAIKDYKKRHLKWRVKSFIQKVLHKQVSEEPLLYSNIKLASVDYVPITQDILERKKRINYKSVVLLSEVSLIIDSMSYKDNNLNESCTLFVKLFGHESRGGSMYIETQCVNDMHFGFRRNINKYLWIHSLVKWIPFVLVFRVRELMYNDSNEGITNSFNEDVEESTKILIVPKKVWKKFDCYTYSYFTDNLDSVNEKEYNNYKANLKTDNLVSFKKWLTLERGVESENKEN